MATCDFVSALGVGDPVTVDARTKIMTCRAWVGVKIGWTPRCLTARGVCIPTTHLPPPLFSLYSLHHPMYARHIASNVALCMHSHCCPAATHSHHSATLGNPVLSPPVSYPRLKRHTCTCEHEATQCKVQASFLLSPVFYLSVCFLF